MNLDQFAKRMRETADEVEKGASRIMKKVAGDVHAHVVTATPVLTGKARSNWIVSIGTGVESIIETYGRDAAIPGALNAATAVISAHKGTQPIYIQNNVDYIVKLNEGSSQQAPSNYVLRATEVALNSIQTNSKILLKAF